MKADADPAQADAGANLLGASLHVAVAQAKKEVWTAMQRTNLHLLPRKSHKVHRMRQRNAFPPNFIHSLDASHMMMTALACRDHGEPCFCSAQER